MPDRDLCFTPATELLRLYRARKVSPLEVMQAVLARIDAVNPRVNAYVTLARESALAGSAEGDGRAPAARRARRRCTACRCRSRTSRRPRASAPRGARRSSSTTFPPRTRSSVARLKAAGAIVVGKTNTPEFGAGGNTFNAVFGVTRNPWNPALTCGGSSGGARGGARHRDGPARPGLGPRRIAAHARGLLRRRGLPHHARAGARLSAGARPGTPSRVSGPMARTVSDTALMLSVLAGPDDRAPLSYDVDTRAFPAAVRRAVDPGLARGVDAGPGRPAAGGRRGRRGWPRARPARSGRSARG